MKLPMYFSGKGPRLAVTLPWKTALKTLRSMSATRLAARNSSCHRSESEKANAARAAIKTMWATCGSMYKMGFDFNNITLIRTTKTISL